VGANARKLPHGAGGGAASSRYAGARHRAGITLVESIVSISLLSFAVAGPMTLAAQSIKASGMARAEMIATHLADNASADDNSAGKTAWMTNVFASCDSTYGCVVDPTSHSASNVWNTVAPLPLQECSSACGNASIVYVNPATGLYRQQLSGSLSAPFMATPFRRTVTLVGVDNAATPVRQVRVTSVVSYPGYGGKTQTVSLSEDLYNWFPYLH
jgi:type II secretory pathway pseudopilin PulG